MSPRLLFLLSTVHTHHRFVRDRDRLDARLATARLSGPVLRLVATAPTVPAGDVLLEAA